MTPLSSTDSALHPTKDGTNMASADFCTAVIPLSRDSVRSTLLGLELFRHRADLPGYCALTFPLIPATSTSVLSGSLLDFEYLCLLIQHSRLYVIPVRRASGLLSASFRFRLATDTLAESLAVPSTGPAGVFHSLVNAPCRAHQKKTADFVSTAFFDLLLIFYF